MGRQGQASILLVAIVAIGALVVIASSGNFNGGFTLDFPDATAPGSDANPQPESTIVDQPTIFGNGSEMGGGGEVYATNANCGDIITSSLTLDGDLDCSGYEGTALTIGADDVTLDCNGYTITGNTSGIGVLAHLNFNITIKDCTITNFTGVLTITSTYIFLFI